MRRRNLDGVKISKIELACRLCGRVIPLPTLACPVEPLYCECGHDVPRDRVEELMDEAISEAAATLLLQDACGSPSEVVTHSIPIRVLI